MVAKSTVENIYILKSVNVEMLFLFNIIEGMLTSDFDY